MLSLAMTMRAHPAQRQQTHTHTQALGERHRKIEQADKGKIGH